MNIAVDIDDTLTNTSEYLQSYVADYFGVSLEELSERGISYARLPAEWEDRKLRFWRDTFDQAVPDTPFKEDAEWGLWTLHEMGHRIVIITARTTEFYTDPLKTTLKELENGGVHYDALYCTMDKLSVCREEKIDLFIDDSIKNLRNVSEGGVRVLQMQSPVNEKEKAEFPRVSNWKEVVEIIKKM